MHTSVHIILQAAYALERNLDIEGFRDAIEGSAMHKHEMSCKLPKWLAGSILQALCKSAVATFLFVLLYS